MVPQEFREKPPDGLLAILRSRELREALNVAKAEFRMEMVQNAAAWVNICYNKMSHSEPDGQQPQAASAPSL